MRRLVAIFGAAMLVATACSGGNPPATSGAPSASVAASQAPVPGGRVVVGATGDPKTMQPVISTDTQSSDIWNWLYLGLTRSNYKTGETEPNLAEKFELSKDGLTLTYTIRDGLVWSDGTPFSGEDWRYTVHAVARSAKTVRKSTFQDIVGWADYRDGKADAISGIVLSNNNKTLAITFTKVFCPAVAAMGSAGGGILPSAAFKKVWNEKTLDTKTNIDDNALNMNPPASMGPFVFKEFKPGIQVSFTRNDKYWRGAPLVDELVVKVYADATAIKNALVTGEVTYGSVEAKDYEEVSKVDALSGYRYKSSGYTYIGWNAKSAKAPWLASRDVRQALWYGINVDAIMKKILFGLGTQVYGHNPPTSWAYDTSGLTTYGNDVAKAKSLLEKAGAKMGSDGIYRWTDGSPMKMRIETNQGNNARETILQFAQEQYKAIAPRSHRPGHRLRGIHHRMVPGSRPGPVLDLALEPAGEGSVQQRWVREPGRGPGAAGQPQWPGLQPGVAQEGTPYGRPEPEPGGAVHVPLRRRRPPLRGQEAPELRTRHVQHLVEHRKVVVQEVVAQLSLRSSAGVCASRTPQ